MLYCVQSVDPRQGDHGICQRLVACSLKKADVYKRQGLYFMDLEKFIVFRIFTR